VDTATKGVDSRDQSLRSLDSEGHREARFGAYAPRVGLSLTGLVSRVGVMALEPFELKLPQGRGNGRSPEGDPKSRLWVAGAGRVQEHEQPGQTEK
jgi:hypothetical protein